MIVLKFHYHSSLFILINTIVYKINQATGEPTYYRFLFSLIADILHACQTRMKLWYKLLEKKGLKDYLGTGNLQK